MTIAFKFKFYEFSDSSNDTALASIDEDDYPDRGVPTALIDAVRSTRNAVQGWRRPVDTGQEIPMRERYMIPARLLRELKQRVAPQYTVVDADRNEHHYYVHFDFSAKTGKKKWDPKKFGVTVPVSRQNDPLDVAFFLAIEE